MTPEKPASPAVAIRLQDAPREPGLIEQVRPGHFISAVLLGAPTVLFSALMVGALAVPFLSVFRPPTPIAETVLFTVIPGVGLAVFATRWVGALRRVLNGPVLSSFLVVPFFIVVGAAGGLAFVKTALGNGFADSIVRESCREHLGEGLSTLDDLFVACEAAGARCVEGLLADGQTTPEALRSCMRTTR